MKYNIALVGGDGIGPEIVDSAVHVLDKIAEKFGHEFIYASYLAGGAAIDEYGVPLPQETIDGCLASDSVLLGAVGGPKWDSQPPANRPERAILGLRAALGLFTNLRPAKIFPALADACTLRPDIAARGFDLVIVRELTGGIYFGERGRREGANGTEAYDTECYSVMEIERIAKVAFETAMKRRKSVVSIDKANVLESSRLWRETVDRIAADYPEVSVEHMYVDNAAMQLVRDPSHFDVVLTSNIFGDILSDEASQITGSIGMLASSSLGASTRGLYEPIHGSAPDITGMGIANPIATILSAAMMLRYSFGLTEEADAIEAAVNKALDDGIRTRDIAVAGQATVTTDGMTEAILERL